MKMSLSDNKTGELIMILYREKMKFKIKLIIFFSISIYDEFYLNKYNRDSEFENWASVEVPEIRNISGGMESFLLPSGLYALFFYKGINTDTKIFKYIFQIWLPDSEYLLDERPYFEILGEKYKNNDPDSEEEIYIPVKGKE